ncbi:hypothetical protein V7266_30645 [Neobacillus drentensis]|uniref:hypothetical protein n=1 Tax=Neobacillus drentensis TaxID=220684 RepID=UPI002FFE9BDC
MYDNVIAALTLINTVVFGVLAFRFNRKLEDQKYKISRKYKDFELYTVKRHETYPELFKLILITYNKASGSFSKSNSLHFEGYNTEDIKYYLEEQKIPIGKINEIVQMWDQSRELAILEIIKFEQLISVKDAWQSFTDAANYLYQNELYISDEVADHCRQIFFKLQNLNLNLKYPNPETVLEDSRLIVETRNALFELKNIMRQELSIAYNSED